MNYFTHNKCVRDSYHRKKSLAIIRLTTALIMVSIFQTRANSYTLSPDSRASEKKPITGKTYAYEAIRINSSVNAGNKVTANDIQITGKVLDEMDRPVIGATVKIKGGTGGSTVTDVNGIFHITAPENAVLTVSFIGYDPQDVAVGGQSTLSIKLKQSSKNLNEVVVVGYGTQKKGDLTGSIGSVNNTTIARAATPSAAGALQGAIPGVVVVKSTGKPGTGYSINIRGTNSVGGDNSPLYVIDGIPLGGYSNQQGISTSALSDLNPADIESIDVLKDASATAIYGSRGAKGVVIVTTKRGKAGKTNISYDGYVGSRNPTHLPDMMDGPEFVAFRTEMFKAQGKDVSRANNTFFTPDQWNIIDAGQYTDWPKLVLKNGLQMSHNISASGGDEKTKFALSAGVLREDGNISPEQFTRYTLRGNVDRQISDQWKTGINFYLAQNYQNEGSSEALRSAYRLPPVAYPYDASGNLMFRVYGTDAVTNPFFDMNDDLREDKYLRTFGNIYLQFQPISHLTLKTSFSPEILYGRNGTYNGPLSKASLGGAILSGATYATSNQYTYVWDNQATYDAQFNGGHKLTATLVQSIQSDQLETQSTSVSGLPYRSLWYNLGSATNRSTAGVLSGATVASNYTQYTLSSARARVNYSYKDKYLLTMTAAVDGSSHLAVGHQWGFFPSASFGWRLSEEKFIKNIDAIDNLKLRLSYGESGNDRISPYSTQATLTQTNYTFGSIAAPGYAPNQLANTDLTWEVTRELNLGLDFSIIKNRISGTVDLYRRNIDKVLLSRQLPPQTGFGSIVDNIGKLRNSGIELSLNTVNVSAGKFTWNSSFVFEANKNEILETSNGKNDDVGSLLFIGQPVQVNYDYVFDGIWQTSEATQAAIYNAKPGQIRVKDLDNNGVINASDRAVIGKRIPSWTGSFGNTFRYGNVDLYVMAYTRQGEQYTSSFDAGFLNFNQNYNQVNINYWTASNPSQTHFQPGNPGTYAGIANYRTLNFVRISNITLGYSVPKRFLEKYKINNLRLYATATNPFLFTKYEGFDPEWASQNTFGTAVSSATYLLGVNLSF